MSEIDFSSDVLDFSDIRDADQPWPAGIYGPARITKAEKKLSQSGNTYWSLMFRVQEGEAVGSNFFYNITLSPKSMMFAKRDLNRLGIDTTGEVSLAPELFLGRAAMLRVGIREYDGAERNEVREILPIDQGTEDIGKVF